jgi:hypothetical protein
VFEYEPNPHIEAASCHFEAAPRQPAFSPNWPRHGRPCSARATPWPGILGHSGHRRPERFKRVESSRSFDDNRPAQVDPFRTFAPERRTD